MSMKNNIIFKHIELPKTQEDFYMRHSCHLLARCGYMDKAFL